MVNSLQAQQEACVKSLIRNFDQLCSFGKDSIVKGVFFCENNRSHILFLHCCTMLCTIIHTSRDIYLPIFFLSYVHMFGSSEWADRPMWWPGGQAQIRSWLGHHIGTGRIKIGPSWQHHLKSRELAAEGLLGVMDLVGTARHLRQWTLILLFIWYLVLLSRLEAWQLVELLAKEIVNPVSGSQIVLICREMDCLVHWERNTRGWAVQHPCLMLKNIPQKHAKTKCSRVYW